MLRIRFSRVGKKNQPSFKIVVIEKSGPPKGGRFVEVVGSYSPLTKERFLRKDRIQYWISKGAKPSASLNNLLVSEKVLAGKKIPVNVRKPLKEAEAKKETLIAESSTVKGGEDINERQKVENSTVGISKEKKITGKVNGSQEISSGEGKSEEKNEAG